MLRKIGVLALVLLLSLSLLACEAKNIVDVDENIDIVEEENEEVEIISYEPAYGGELVVPITYVKTLNPLLTRDRSLYYFNKLIYEGLFEFDKNLNIKNILAESYEIKNDGKVIDIKLRDDVYWHYDESNPEIKAQKFTASDVKFTIDVLKYGASDTIYKEMLSNVFNPAKPTDLEHILKAKVIDENNISIEFDRSYSNALESLIFPIIPKHQFTQGSDSNKAALNKAFDPEYIKKPIGTGPYKFVNHESLKFIELESNKNWWNGRSYIDKIIGQILPDNEVGITLFETGNIDLALTLGVDWDKYSENQNVKTYEYMTQKYEFLGFNFNNELFQGEMGKSIRKAVAYGIDKQSIINKIYLGHGTESELPIPPNSWLLSNEIDTYDYNISKAREILELAGWVDKDEDGIYEDINGKKLSFRLLTNSNNDLRRETANLIIDSLKNIGIEVIPQYNTNKENNVYIEASDKQWEDLKGKIFTGDYDVALLGWELSSIPDLAFAFHSTQIEKGSNFISYQNEKMDELILEAFKATSRDEKRETYEKIQNMLIDELPYVSLFFKNSSILINDRVHGEISPQPFNLYYNINKWYIPEVLQKEAIEDKAEEQEQEAEDSEF